MGRETVTGMTTETKPRMTVREIALMREIVKWRRANGWIYLHPAAPWVESESGRAVSLTEDGDIGITDDYHRAQYEWYRAHSVTEAVDLLAALGYLPARFSSAWWAGWNAAAMDLALADYRAETSK
jgi:hypothetical protein